MIALSIAALFAGCAGPKQPAPAAVPATPEATTPTAVSAPQPASTSAAAPVAAGPDERVLVLLKSHDAGLRNLVAQKLGTVAADVKLQDDAELTEKILNLKGYDARKEFASSLGGNILVYGEIYPGKIVAENDAVVLKLALFDERFVGMKSWSVTSRPDTFAVEVDKIIDKAKARIEENRALPPSPPPAQ